MGSKREVLAIQGPDTKVDETIGQISIKTQQVSHKEDPESWQDRPTYHPNLRLLEQTPKDLIVPTEWTQVGEDLKMSQTSTMEVD